MTKSLFVGGLPYEKTQEEVAALFSSCGQVTSVRLVMDGDRGRSKGFGFVEMSTEEQAREAIAKLNGAKLGQREIFVAEARPQQPRPQAPAARAHAGEPARAGSKIPGGPGFVERRSGVKDRRRQQPSGPAERRPGPGAKRWERKPGGFRDKKPGGFRAKKKWGGKKRAG